MRKNRIRGMLEGHALGDSLGSAYEFKSSPRPETFNGVYEHPVNTSNRFQGARNGVLGQVTDDFEMTLTLACSLIRNQGFNREDVILSYARWAQGSKTGKGCSFQGKNTRRLFKNKTLQKYEENYAAAMNEDLMTIESNGSLMRAIAISIFPDLDPRLDTILTNPAPINQECSVLYVFILRQILAETNSDQIYSYILTYDHSPRLKELFAEVERIQILDDFSVQNFRDLKPQKGWILHGMYCSLFVLKFYSVVRTHSARIPDGLSIFKYFMKKIINFGGDTDTNAAIAGAVLGALLGSEELIRTDLDLLTVLYGYDSKLGDFPRPDPEQKGDFYIDVYHPKYIPDVVERLVML